MSCANSVLITKGITVPAGATEVLPYNLHRKGLLVALGSGTIKFAFGESPGDADFVTMRDGDVIIFDSLIPSSQMWAKGPGVIVLGEAS